MRQRKNVLIACEHDAAEDFLVPAKPLPLVAKTPRQRDPEIPDGLWDFPMWLAHFGNRRKKSQKELAQIAGVSQSTISRWLDYKGLDEIAVLRIMRLEAGLRLPHGRLTRSPDLPEDEMVPDSRPRRTGPPEEGDGSWVPLNGGLSGETANATFVQIKNERRERKGSPGGGSSSGHKRQRR